MVKPYQRIVSLVCIACETCECERCNVEDLAKRIIDDVRADAIDEVSRAMYHQCFECNNDEDMQRWDSGNWFRYKLFENVIEQLKEQNDRIGINSIHSNI